MYPRNYKLLKKHSFFLFGPRGTGKTTWLRSYTEGQVWIDFLHAETYRQLLGNPSRIESHIPESAKNVVIDEVQKIPEILDEVHRLIEERKINFILTGSSARKLKRQGINLLAGRARQRFFHPLTCWELGKEFNLKKALQYGMLPSVWSQEDPKDYLNSYIQTYLREEVMAEGLVRNLGTFTSFLEAASFSQAMPTTMTRIAIDVGVDSKVIANYFSILEDLLLAYRLPVFSKRAKRRMTTHPKFFYFDAGVFRCIRPRGPLDSDSELDGASLETLFFQHYRVLGEYNQWDQKPYFWKTANKHEVDFVSYGQEGLFAFEIKRSSSLRDEDFDGLRAFKQDYPMAKCFLLNFVSHETQVEGVRVVPYEKALWEMASLFNVNQPLPE